jgi:hypothetical protein
LAALPARVNALSSYGAQPVGGYPQYDGYYPVSTPEPPLVTEEDIKMSLVKQIEYYFSDANLAKG